MKKIILVSFVILLGIDCISAQINIDINNVNMLNMPGGRRYVHVKDNDRTPLSGQVNLIDGMLGYISANFREGYVDGQWECYENNKLIESTCYSDGYPNGEYIKLSKNGDIRMLGHYEKGKKKGIWDEFNNYGDKIKTTVYEADDNKHRVIYYYTDGSIKSEQEFKDDREDGFYRIYTYEDHQLKSEKNYVCGRLVGKQFMWFTTNLQDYYRYENYDERGNLDGDFIEIYIGTDYIKTKGKYSLNHKIGKWVYGNPDGTIKTEEIYENGRLMKRNSLSTNPNNIN